MKQLDLFEFKSIYDSVGYDKMSTQKMNWPNDFDGAHQVGGVNQQKPKIYESPDKGKTIYEREFGANPSTRQIVKTSVQRQWDIKYKVDGENL